MTKVYANEDGVLKVTEQKEEVKTYDIVWIKQEIDSVERQKERLDAQLVELKVLLAEADKLGLLEEVVEEPVVK